MQRTSDKECSSFQCFFMFHLMTSILLFFRVFLSCHYPVSIKCTLYILSTLTLAEVIQAKNCMFKIFILYSY